MSPYPIAFINTATAPHARLGASFGYHEAEACEVDFVPSRTFNKEDLQLSLETGEVSKLRRRGLNRSSFSSLS